MNGCENERGDNSLPLWNFIEMFAFCESKTVKYKHYFIFVYLLRYWKFDNKNIFMPQEQEVINFAILKVMLRL